jgi:23S rRNA pseudouridine1911/1915/1917 synthase
MKITIDSKFYNQRLDKFVQLKLKDLGFKQATRSMIKENISKGVLVNREQTKSSYRLKQEDMVEIDERFWKEFFEKEDLSEKIIPQKADLNIIYEDKHLIVLVKPKGMIVHPGVSTPKNTLANYLRGYLEQKNEFDVNMDRAGIVHRLDKGVSGIMVTAKNKHVQEELKKQFARRKVEKIYLADVEKFKSSELSSIAPKNIDNVIQKIKNGEANYDDWFEAKGYVGRNLRDRYKMEFKLYQFSGSKPAKSYILPLLNDQMLIKIVTGRTHQIRATLYYYGYLIRGDTLYKPGRDRFSSDEIMLKSIYLSFIHPITKKRLSFIHK